MRAQSHPSIRVIIAIVLGLSSTAFADNATYVICKNGKEVRTLRAQQNAAKGKCEAIYTKSGKSQNVGEGQNPDTCDQIVTRIRGTLETADWKCREVKDSTVSEVVDEVR